jgi:hypothetical protein
MEGYLKKIKWKMTSKKIKMEDDLEKNWKTTSIQMTKIENDHTHNLKKSTLIGCDIIVN